MFGAIIAQKAQVISAPRAVTPAHLPFNCILVRVDVPAVAGEPEDSVGESSLFTFNTVLVFADPEIKVKDVEAFNPDTIFPVTNCPAEFE
jgi:hypothetical protein